MAQQPACHLKIEVTYQKGTPTQININWLMTDRGKFLLNFRTNREEFEML